MLVIMAQKHVCKYSVNIYGHAFLYDRIFSSITTSAKVEMEFFYFHVELQTRHKRYH
jgi:hypothetical protein